MRAATTCNLFFALFLIGCSSNGAQSDRELISQFEKDVHPDTIAKIRKRMPGIEHELLRSYENGPEGASMMFGGEILGELGAEATDGYVARSLKSLESAKVAKALFVLRHRNGDKISADTYSLLRGMAGGGNPSLKALACSVLVSDEDARSREAVLKWLKTAPQPEKSMIISNIGERRARKYFGYIAPYLLDPDEEVRSSTVIALHDLDSARAAPILQNHKDKSDRIRNLIRDLLGT